MHENIAIMAVDITNRFKKVNITTLEELVVCLIIENKVDTLDSIIEGIWKWKKK